MYSESNATSLPEVGNTRGRSDRMRTLIAFWILGLCNNYGYVVMLTAANDIIEHNMDSNSDDTNTTSNARDCTYMSTGAILLADILPALLVKFLAPFIPFMVHVRVAACVIFAAAGFISVAFGQNITLALMGVVFTAFCSGLGEVTYLQYSSFYQRNVVSAWSSGTGGAGVIGALSYSLLQYFGMKTSLLIMLVVPASMAISFWIILPKPMTDQIPTEFDEEKIEIPHPGFLAKLRLIPRVLKYMIPFALVYLFEYFINQGTFELIKIKNSSIPQDSQYRWLQVTYQVGVFISRSSVNLFHIRQTWIMAFLQGVNVIIFTTEAIYYYIPNFYIVVALVLWEGLLGGSSYVNTYYRISTEVPQENKQYYMAITAFGDSAGISLAGLFAILAHNKICDMPL
ncbi:battenin [Cylas formicarius]|uniref:battenin n=1 Tax=Cylas formicarius TaxID=197179 RepID=UPI002958458A|nr:battenin [Cylas formicarius]XP_060537470.1 battenin [Cylas formicarius]XP_060537471.1 battenin [Cylas formicarius]